MPKFNPDQINIHEITVEQLKKESDAVFDIERDITYEDRQLMHKRLEELRTEKKSYQDFADGKHYFNWVHFAKVASDMVVMGENPKITEHDLLKIEDELYFRRRKKDWQIFSKVAVCLAKLGYKPNLLSEDIAGMTKQTEENRLSANSNYSHFADMVEAMKIFGQDVQMSERDWELLEQGVRMSKLDRAKKYKDHYNGRSAGGYFAQDIILGRDPKVTKEELILIKEDLDRCRKITSDHHNGYELSELAASLAIITAEKVEIIKNRLKITRPNKADLQNGTPQLPEQKSF